VRSALATTLLILTTSVAACGGGGSAGNAGAGTLEPRPNVPKLHDGEAAACLPGCVHGLATPGPLEPGTRYQTRWFFGGYMTVQPHAAWGGREDSSGELKLILPGDDEYGVGFALDLFPVRGERRVTTQPRTVRQWITWYRHNPSLETSNETATTIGGLAATRVDLTPSKDATNDDPDCPAPTCVNIWGFPQWGHPGGIAGDDVYRQYLANVVYSGTRHVFSVTVEARDRSHLKAIAEPVEELLRTVTIPAHAG
jgi:hypothetical protein